MSSRTPSLPTRWALVQCTAAVYNDTEVNKIQRLHEWSTLSWVLYQFALGSQVVTHLQLGGLDVVSDGLDSRGALMISQLWLVDCVCELTTHWLFTDDHRQPDNSHIIIVNVSSAGHVALVFDGITQCQHSTHSHTHSLTYSHTHTHKLILSFPHTHSYTLTHSHIHSHTFTHTHTCPAVSVTQHLSTRSIQTAQACTKAALTLTLM